MRNKENIERLLAPMNAYYTLSEEALKKGVSAPIAALIDKRITHFGEAYDAADKNALIELVGHPLNEYERTLVKGWLKECLFPPSEKQREREKQRMRAFVYNLVIEQFDRCGMSKKDAIDHILKSCRKDFGKDVGDDAVDRFLRRAEKGEFGTPVPRYRNQFGQLDLEAPPKWEERWPRPTKRRKVKDAGEG